MPSPPKPWEVNGGSSSAVSTPIASATASSSSISGSGAPSSGNLTANSSTPPPRPSTMSSSMGMNSGMGMSSGLGMSSSYGGYGSGLGTYGSSYNSPYSRFGGYGSSYGGYGGLSGGYGGYSGYGGYGGFGSPYSPFGSTYNRFGGPGGPGDEFSLTQRMEASTRATFEIIEQVVGAFGGFAQMLDSTYMATHSSFMAMVGVAEQFGNLRHYLGNLLGIFALIRWVRRLFYRLTGRQPPPELVEPPSDEQQQQSLEGLAPEQQQEQLQLQQQQQQPSKRRSVLFMLAIVLGLPYMMFKLFQKVAEYQEKQQKQILLAQQGEEAQVVYDFVAENPMELNLRRGETVHVLSKVDPATGQPASWWFGRLLNGQTGLFPANYVQIKMDPKRIR